MIQVILLVEDSEFMSRRLVYLLSKRASYIVIHALDGPAALQITHDIQPDLFLLDYQLPAMNGIELYDQLHCQKGMHDVPAIILSTCIEDDNVRQAICQRHLPGVSKPFDGG